MEPIRVRLYMKENCPLCDDALRILEQLRKEKPFTIELIDIYTDDHWLEKYQLRIPVVAVNQQIIAEGIVHETALREALFTDEEKE